MSLKAFRNLLLIPLLAVLGACEMIVLNPAGQVAIQERDMLVASTLIMLIIIIPVLVLIGVIAWRYRDSRQNASDYDPDWEHSLHLEFVIWAAPLLIIIALGALTWIGTHMLDPYRPLEVDTTVERTEGIPERLRIDVVSLDWQWLFLYPQYGIATVNQVAAPVDVPIHFRLASETVMNTFYVPALAGMVYTMAGMKTDLHAVINKLGDYKGFSANLSGDGFTDMRFRFLGQNEADFLKWVDKVRSEGDDLTPEAYLALTEPTRNGPVRYYADFAPDLFYKIVLRCVDPGVACMPHGKMDMAGHGTAGHEAMNHSGGATAHDADDTAARIADKNH